MGFSYMIRLYLYAFGIPVVFSYIFKDINQIWRPESMMADGGHLGLKRQCSSKNYLHYMSVQYIKIN